jgi:hypothetical protein
MSHSRMVQTRRKRQVAKKVRARVRKEAKRATGGAGADKSARQSGAAEA